MVVPPATLAKEILLRVSNKSMKSGYLSASFNLFSHVLQSIIKTIQSVTYLIVIQFIEIYIASRAYTVGNDTDFFGSESLLCNLFKATI